MKARARSEEMKLSWSSENYSSIGQFINDMHTIGQEVEYKISGEWYTFTQIEEIISQKSER